MSSSTPSISSTSSSYSSSSSSSSPIHTIKSKKKKKTHLNDVDVVSATAALLPGAFFANVSENQKKMNIANVVQAQKIGQNIAIRYYTSLPRDLDQYKSAVLVVQNITTSKELASIVNMIEYTCLRSYSTDAMSFHLPLYNNDIMFKDTILFRSAYILRCFGRLPQTVHYALLSFNLSNVEYLSAQVSALLKQLYQEFRMIITLAEDSKTFDITMTMLRFVMEDVHPPVYNTYVLAKDQPVLRYAIWTFERSLLVDVNPSAVQILKNRIHPPSKIPFSDYLRYFERINEIHALADNPGYVPKLIWDMSRHQQVSDLDGLVQLFSTNQ